jgi:hypothetical protein
MLNYRTCTHTDDSGHICQSVAAKNRDYCGFHLRYRGRLLRQAQYRARHQRFDLTLPPLDSLCSIQSALCQVVEALAADMVDPRRAQGLLKALRFAKENLRDSLKENSDWHATPYHTERAEAYDNFESDYGLPDNIDVSVPPDVTFPPPLTPQGVILSITTPELSRHTAPWTPGVPRCLPRRFFVRSIRATLYFRIRSYLESCGGPLLVPPTIYPATAPRLSSSVSPTLAGRRAAHSSVRSNYRFPQDDPGLPACRTSSAYVHSLRSIQYNLTANRRATITLATARLPLRTHNRL